MIVVHKFPIPMPEDDSFTTQVTMPEGADICSIGVQRELPYVWALVDPHQQRTQTVPLLIMPTGARRLEGSDRLHSGVCLGRLEFAGSSFIYHVFRI